MTHPGLAQRELGLKGAHLSFFLEIRHSLPAAVQNLKLAHHTSTHKQQEHSGAPRLTSLNDLIAAPSSSKVFEKGGIEPEHASLLANEVHRGPGQIPPTSA